MASNEKDWPIDYDKAALARYLAEARDMSVSINAGQRISDLRNLIDISAIDLAKKCDISTLELLALEAGMMQLQPDLAQRLATEIGVDYSDIYLSEEDEK